MHLSVFLSVLHATGTLRLQNAAMPEDLDRPELVDALTETYRQASLEFPGAAPAFDRETAIWAAVRLYRACQFLIFREIGKAEVVAGLSSATTKAHETAAGIFSADLTFRYLPDVYRLAKGLSTDDPLNQMLEALAVQWPVSAVGMPVANSPIPEAVTTHDGLAHFYVDRIIEHRAYERLVHPRLVELARGAVGAYPEFATALHEKLEEKRD